MVIDEVPYKHSWPEALLGAVASIIVGGTPSTAHKAFWDSGDVPWMSSGDVHLRLITDVPGRITKAGLLSSNAKLVESPSVAVALAGQGKTRGLVGYVVTPLSTNQSVALLVSMPCLHAKYLFHNLDLRYEELRARSAGGGRGSLSISILEDVPIPMPSLAEQRRIADLLDAADAVICHTEALIAKLRQVKAGLLHDLLTRGVDEQGHLRDPVTSPKQFKDSSLGLIPRSWELSGVASEFDVSSGFTLGEHRRPRLNPRKYLRVANVQRDRIDVADLLELEACDADMRGMTLEKGDLLVVEGHADPEEIGRCAMVGAEAVGLTFQNHLFRLRSKRAMPAFGNVWMNSSSTRSYWRRMCGTSSGLNTINRTMLKAILIPIPPPVEQQRICEAVQKQEVCLQVEQAYRDKLKLQKQGLAHDLLTGRVRV